MWQNWPLLALPSRLYNISYPTGDDLGDSSTMDENVTPTTIAGFVDQSSLPANRWKDTHCGNPCDPKWAKAKD